MPQALPFIEAAFDFVSTAISTLGPALAGDLGLASQLSAYAVVTAGLYEASTLLAPSTPQPAGQKITVRQTLPPRYRGCGHTRMGGALLLDYAQGQNLRQVIAFADCPVSNIDGYWLNQDQVTLTGTQVNTLANGAYSRVLLDTHYGVSGTTAFPLLTAAYPAIWPATCYGSGIFMGFLSCSNGKIEEFTKDFPRGPQLQFNIAGDIDVFYDWRQSGQSQTDPTTWTPCANAIVCLVNDLWRNHDYDWASDFAPTLSILTAEANVCDEAVPVLNVLAKVSLDANAGAAVVRLKNIGGLTAGTILFVAGQSFTVLSLGASHADGTDVNLSGGLTTPVSAGGLARWQSNPSAPLNKPRYEAHGRWIEGEPESDTVKRFLECMDGWMMRRGSDGALVVRAGHYVAPSVVIGLDEIIDYGWDGFVDLGKIVNERVPSYVEPANDYNQIDTTPWRDDDSVDRDGLSSQPFAPGLVQSNSQVRRLAKARMSRDQQPVRTLTLKASGLRCLGERFLQLPTGGIEVDEMNGAIVEVVGDFEIVDNGMHVQLQIQLFEPACYDWDYLTEEGSGPADVSSPVGTVLVAPIVTSATPEFDTIVTGQAGVRLAVGASGPARDDITWSVRTRKTGAVSWDETTDRSLIGGSVTILSNFVPADTSVDVQVAYMTGAGVLSPWSTTWTETTATDTTTPDPLTGLAVSSWDATLLLICNPVARARTYAWSFYKADGTTLIKTYTTSAPTFPYTAAQAASDGAQRSYVIKAAGVNAAGAGTLQAIAASKAAPTAVTGASGTGGTTTGQVAFTAISGVAGYLVAYSDTSGFNPVSYGSSVKTGASPAYLGGLSAGTYYAKVAAYDAWSADPSLLNFSNQTSFAISTGGGSTPPGGGVGGGAGGGGGGSDRYSTY